MRYLVRQRESERENRERPKMIAVDVTFGALPVLYRCPCRKPASGQPTPSSSVYARAHVFQASALDEAPQQRDKLEAEKEQVPRRPIIMHKRPEPSVPQRVPTLVRIKAYKKEALLQRRVVELEEEAVKIDLDPDKLLKQGDPSSVQAVVRQIIPVGLFLTMPNGKEGFLPSTDFGFSGGVVILRRLFKIGQVLTVTVLRNGGGREIVSMRKELPEED